MIKKLWQVVSGRGESSGRAREEFRRRFSENLRACRWEPHPLYSVFTQYDKEYYLKRRDEFLHKYRSFYAVSKTVSPESIIELGVSAGSGADAYLSASPHARYTGIDTFGESSPAADGSTWKPYDIARQLLGERGFKSFDLLRADLRGMDRLPHAADLVVVDAAHDFDNEYADLRLALTARPAFIFVDDADDKEQALPAIEKFLREDLEGRVEYTLPIDYIGGGLVIKVKW
jgi:predicted O-methyltransferase YrrM